MDVYNVRSTIASTLVFFALCASTMDAAKILVSMLIPVVSSHSHGMSAVSRALVEGGHDVTVLTSSTVGLRGFEDGTYTRALQFHYLTPPDTTFDFDSVCKEITANAFEDSISKKLYSFQLAVDIHMHGCRCLLDDDATMSTLKASTFDVVISDLFDGCDALLSSSLDVPLIAVTTAARYPFFHEHIFGVPAPSSYIPFGILPLTNRMSFWDRVVSYLEHHVIIPTFGAVHFRALNRIKDDKGIAPGRDIRDILAKAELWMCMAHFAFDYPKPLAPNWVSIGGIVNMPAKPLSKEYEDFVLGSGDHGFIVFTMGTFFTEFPKPETAEHFAHAFSQLPYRVLWRYTGKRPQQLGNNTMIVDWLPQNDLLGHPKARLLIYHGGIHGIYEAIYHGVPMVIMPIFAEQHSNAANVAGKGMGRILHKDALSVDIIHETITEVIENPKYFKRVQHYSGIYRDTLAKPAESAVFWVEHVIKFGASHLRLRSTDLSTLQLQSVDVLAFILGCMLFVGFVLISCCRCCVFLCCKKGKSKTE